VKDKIIVALMSCGEPTTQESLDKLNQMFDEVVLVEEVPHSKAIRKCYEIGLSSDKEWLLIAGADGILYPEAMQEFLDTAENMVEEKTFHFSSYCDDKFRVGNRYGWGIYRTKYLDVVLANLSETDITPEGMAMTKTIAQGYLNHVIPIKTSTHDYGQLPFDVYRKGYMWSRRLQGSAISNTTKHWLSKYKEDKDFRYLLEGYGDGIKNIHQEYFCDSTYHNRNRVKYLIEDLDNKEDHVVTMFSVSDFAGSGYHYAEAINRHTKFKVRQFVSRQKISCPFDAEFVASQNPEFFQECMRHSDILHLKWDGMPIIKNGQLHLYRREYDNFMLVIGNKTYSVPVNPDAGTIVTHCGTASRRDETHPVYNKWTRPKTSEIINNTHIRTALSPDLCYPDLNNIFTPHAIDSQNAQYTWKERKIPIIGCYPATNDRKGVDQYLKTALNYLASQGYKFHLIETKNMSNAKCIEAKKDFTIMFDQVTSAGTYGRSAIEAMQFGVPVICYISEEAKRQSCNEIYQNSPVLNPGNTVEGMIELLRNIFDGKINLKEVSVKTKKYCDELHGYRASGKQWEQIYKELLILKEIRKINYVWANGVEPNFKVMIPKKKKTRIVPDDEFDAYRKIRKNGMRRYR
jgi:hypothetical protein